MFAGSWLIWQTYKSVKKHKFTSENVWLEAAQWELSMQRSQIGFICFHSYLLRKEAPSVKCHCTIEAMCHLHEVCKILGARVVELKDISEDIPCFPGRIQ